MNIISSMLPLNGYGRNNPLGDVMRELTLALQQKLRIDATNYLEDNMIEHINILHELKHIKTKAQSRYETNNI
jgi:hypothetical protein